ncbi:Pre-mRNA-splicing factor of RES complex-domain-containing protein [Fennellomyces sp. T-0311]|nr:Pre-mRNA-splicing factor of RES complex-domain-containing protein [Fennellomyces sp. T-0311]
MDPEEREANARLKYLARGPGDAATKAYIASKYLSSEPEKKKKKKKKVVRKGNLGIVDDEEVGWKQVGEVDVKAERLRREREEQERLVSETKGVFQGKSDNWQTIQEADDKEAEDERPVIVQEEEIEESIGGPKMSSGQRAGLLTSHELKQEAARAREAERQMVQKLQGDASGRDAETVYRDETGRRIDPKIMRAEEARAKKEAVEREERRMEWGKGLVQRSEAESKRRQLEEEKDKALARYADDEDYNQGLREQQRWNDPAAGFLTSQSTSKGLVRPKYKGPWKPNRFMIPPGCRWDGVDRSNGFEDQFLLQENHKKARAIEAHAWSTEDM